MFKKIYENLMRGWGLGICLIYYTYKSQNFNEWCIKVNGKYVAGLIMIDGNDQIDGG